MEGEEAEVVKTGGMLENLMRFNQNSFKSLFQRKKPSISSSIATNTSEDVLDSPTPIPQLSPLANSVVARCSKILRVNNLDLQHRFDIELPESVKQLYSYARTLLEYCCYQTLLVVTRRPDYLSDLEFRRLTFDMMLAWESPSVEHSQSQNSPTETASPSSRERENEDGWSLFYSNPTNMAVQVDDTKTVGKEAFSRIAPACPVVADVITVHNLFDALTSTSSNRLHFLIYDKYIRSLDRIIKAAKSIPGPLVSNLQLAEGEIILEVDGTVPTQPVLQHIGISAWPGRLTLTNYALYFESLGVGVYDKPVRYDLAMDIKQVVRPEMTGPLGARLFDKAVMYKSMSVSEAVYFEFPEFKGNSRRDYWLAICLEILYAHNFIRKHKFEEIQKLEALARAIIGILRYRAMREAFQFFSSDYNTLLAFNMAESLPRGDVILETLSQRLAVVKGNASQGDVIGSPYTKRIILPPIAILSLTQLGFVLHKDANLDGEPIKCGELLAGETNPLEIAVKKTISDVVRAEAAQETVNKVKVEGIDTNIAVMKELLFPVIELASSLQQLTSWEDPFKSMVFLVLSCYAILRDWTRYLLPSLFACCAVFMFLRRYLYRGKPLEAFTVTAPPVKNAVEQLLTLQDAITQVEALIQAGNIALLKIRAVLFAVLPQATERVALLLISTAAVFAFVPVKHILLLVFAEAFTRQMPYRKESSERSLRRLREWWIRMPAAPVQLIRLEDKKKK